MEYLELTYFYSMLYGYPSNVVHRNDIKMETKNYKRSINILSKVDYSIEVKQTFFVIFESYIN